MGKPEGALVGMVEVLSLDFLHRVSPGVGRPGRTDEREQEGLGPYVRPVLGEKRAVDQNIDVGARGSQAHPSLVEFPGVESRLKFECLMSCVPRPDNRQPRRAGISENLGACWLD